MSEYRAIGYGGVPDAQRRSCYDCWHCRGYVHWWCTNDAAVETRGTNFPGVIHCWFWAPIEFVPSRRNVPDSLWIIPTDLSDNPPPPRAQGDPIHWRPGWFSL